KPAPSLAATWPNCSASKTSSPPRPPEPVAAALRLQKPNQLADVGHILERPHHVDDGLGPTLGQETVHKFIELVLDITGLGRILGVTTEGELAAGQPPAVPQDHSNRSTKLGFAGPERHGLDVDLA